MDFTKNKQYEKDDKFLADLPDILNANKSIPEFNFISCKTFLSYLDNSRGLSLLLDITDSRGD